MLISTGVTNLINTFFFRKISVQEKKKPLKKGGGKPNNKKNKVNETTFATKYTPQKNFRWGTRRRKRRRKFKRKKTVVVYRLLFKVTRNNIFITVIDPQFGYVFYSSGGLNYIYTKKRSVAVANILVGENVALALRSKLINVVDVEFQGLPYKSHRRFFLKGLTSKKLQVRNIVDKTPLAHNGCTRKKKRRKKLRRR